MAMDEKGWKVNRLKDAPTYVVRNAVIYLDLQLPLNTRDGHTLLFVFEV